MINTEGFESSLSIGTNPASLAPVETKLGMPNRWQLLLDHPVHKLPGMKDRSVLLSQIDDSMTGLV